jgi:hypothetical protein
MKVPDDVFLLKPPQKELQKKKGKAENDFGNPDARTFSYPIDGVDGHIPHSEMIDIQPHQEVVRHSIAFVNRVEIDGL